MSTSLRRRVSILLTEMRILFMLELDLMSLTGGSRYARRLTEALGRRGHDVMPRLVARGKPGREDLERTDVILWDGMSLISGLASWPELLEGGAHAAMVHSPFSEPELRDEPWIPVKRDELDGLERRLFAAMHAIFVPSGKVRGILTSRYGVRPDIVSVHEPSSDLALARLPPRSLVNDEWRFVSVGSVTARKRQRLLVEALAGVRAAAWRGREWRLEIIGRLDAEPSYVRSILELAESLGVTPRLRLGPRSEEELLGALASSHAHLFPSRDEGYGMAVYESNCAGVPTLFDESACALGPECRSLPPIGAGGDARAWSEAIERFLERQEEWEERARGGRRTPRSWDDVAAGIERRLGGVAGAGH